MLFASLHFSFLGFGWKRVAINSGPKNPKDLLKKRCVSRHKRSPDLNPIGHVWDDLGRAISQLSSPPRNPRN
ncbi:hypothetical protein TNCV_3287291 [Trichonephila clavipes]|nr:hypothetical protein TNCV_3287291 [Trichonephila clavipes]